MTLSKSQILPRFLHAVFNLISLETLDIMTVIRRLPYCLESLIMNSNLIIN